MQGEHTSPNVESGTRYLKDWPPSNYPIFFALVLLAATAATLSMGDEALAEQLAIYAYYLLVIGVIFRFFELALPTSTLQTKLIQILEQLQKLQIHPLKVATRLKPSNPHTTLRQLPPVSTLRLIGQRLSIVDASYIEDVARSTTALLLAFLSLSLLFALTGGWWLVRTYITDLLLVIFATSTVYFLTRTARKK